MSGNEPTSLARRFLGFCVTILVGVVLLHLALQLLSQFWGWLLLFVLIVVGIHVAAAIVRWRRSQW